jgi:hypothetical protein
MGARKWFQPPALAPTFAEIQQPQLQLPGKGKKGK